MSSFFALAAAWCAFHVVRARSATWGFRAAAVLYVVSLTCGLLTFYQSVLALLAGLTLGLVALALLVAIGRQRRERVPAAAVLLGGALLAVVLFSWLHPGFYEPTNARLERMIAALRSYDTFDFRLKRLDRLLLEYSRGLLDVEWTLILGGLLFFASCWVSVFHARKGRPKKAVLSLLPTIFFFGLLAGPAAQYLMRLTPAHVMHDSRYLALGWPFLALGASLLVFIVPGRFHLRSIVALAMCVVAVQGAVGDSRKSRWLSEGLRQVAYLLPKHDLVIWNNARRGVVGPLLPHLRDDARVFVTHGSRRLSVLKKGLERERGGQEALIAHVQGPGVTNSDRRKLQRLLERSGWRLLKKPKGATRIAIKAGKRSGGKNAKASREPGRLEVRSPPRYSGSQLR